MHENVDKCHILISTEKKVHVKTGATRIKNSNSEKLLGVHTDSTLSFEKHVKTIC